MRRSGKLARIFSMTGKTLVIPPLAVVLGLLGSILLAAGLYGLLVPEQTLMPLLSTPSLGWSLAVAGAVLLAIEMGMIVAAIRRR